MAANDVQVGGNYYSQGSAQLQHWDYVVQALAGRYLEGCVTKYASRHRLKNGLEDVKKARHYLQKLREEHAAGRMPPTNQAGPDASKRLHFAYSFSTAQNLPAMERDVCMRLTAWLTDDDLQQVDAMLLQMVDDYERAST